MELGISRDLFLPSVQAPMSIFSTHVRQLLEQGFISQQEVQLTRYTARDVFSASCTNRSVAGSMGSWAGEGLHGLQGRLGGSGDARDAYGSLKEHARDVYVNGVYPSHESTLHTYSYHPGFLYQTDDGAEGKSESSSVETAPRVEGVRDLRAMYPASNRNILQTQAQTNRISLTYDTSNGQALQSRGISAIGTLEEGQEVYENGVGGGGGRHQQSFGSALDTTLVTHDNQNMFRPSSAYFCRGLPGGRGKEALGDQGGGCGSATSASRLDSRYDWDEIVHQMTIEDPMYVYVCVCRCRCRCT